MSSNRTFNYKVNRDVKIVFDIFVETLQGGVPGQPYVVNYERGPKERGHSEPVSAGADGSVQFKYHTSFVSTMQRKNDVSYKRKEFRLWVTEHPSGYITSDLLYDLAGPIENEVFPNKKLMVKSPNGQSKLLFCISGISEDDYIHLMSDRGLTQSQFPRSQSAAASPEPASGAQASEVYREDDNDSEPERTPAPSTNARTNAAASSAPVAIQQPVDDDDDDLEFLVDGAVAQVSGRRGGNTPSQNTPKPAQRSESPAPRGEAAQPPATLGTTKSTAPPQSRPPPSAVPAAVPPPPSESPQATTSTAAPSQAAHRSVSPSVVAPAEQPKQTQVRNTAELARSDTTRHDSASGRSSTPVAEPLEAAAVPLVYQDSSRVQSSNSKSAYTRHAPVLSHNALATTLTSNSSSRAEVSPINESLSRFINDAPRSVSVATTVATSRNEKEVEKYLSEINAAVIAMSNETIGAALSATEVPQSASTGLHTFNVTGGGVKTASSIPRAALLALHCLGYWSGLRRVLFLHDFMAMLFVDVIPHTRHAAQWMNVLLHVLFHTLTQTGDDVDNYYDPLTEDDAVQLSDDLTQCILDAEECGFGARNRFMCRGCRDDRLFHLVARDAGGDEAAASGVQVPMHPGASIVLTIGIDEALRRLSVTASSAALADIERFCFPPPAAPTRHTTNGYHYSGPADSSTAGVGTPYGVGGGGPDHVTEDAAFSVVLNALNRLYVGLHGVTKAHPNGASALLRLTSAELFKIIFRNINNTLLNNVVTKDRNGKLKSRIRTVDDAMNMKLALSMFEGWLQEHQLFIAARAELLGCRQVCDLVILHKRLLMNIELSEEVTSTLAPEMILFLLEQYQPSAKELSTDTVPADVLNVYKREVEERGRAASRSSKKPHSNALAGGPTPLPTRSLATFPFLDFVTSLIPFQDADDAPPSQKRKSLRNSIAAASKVKIEDSAAMSSSSQPRELAKSEQRTLDWDHSNRLTSVRNREAFLGVSTTHDADGNKLSEQESRDAQARLGLRVVALSVAEEDVIRRMVV